jgi:hypothetical protein
MYLVVEQLNCESYCFSIGICTPFCILVLYSYTACRAYDIGTRGIFFFRFRQYHKVRVVSSVKFRLAESNNTYDRCTSLNDEEDCWGYGLPES